MRSRFVIFADVSSVFFSPPDVATYWMPERRRVLTGSTSGEFTAWNWLTFNFETIIRAHDTAIRALASDHTGTHIASADEYGIVKYINNLTESPPHQEAMRSLGFSPSNARLATARDDSTVRVWTFPEGREEHVLPGRVSDIKCFEWHLTMSLFVSDGKDNLLKFSGPALEPGS